MTLLEWMKRWRARGAQAGADARTQEPDADETEVDPYNPFPEGVRVQIADIIDLHTINPREVRKVVEEYLLEARRARFRSVRIIHGKGVGVQREMVRSILGRTPFVVDWTDAPPQAGGLGATIAHLSLEDDLKKIGFIFSPVGTHENSPAIYRWEQKREIEEESRRDG